MMALVRREALEDLNMPWCIDIIRSTEWKAVPSRENSENKLFSDTLWTDTTIRAHQSYYRSPPPGHAFGGELRTLLSLGNGLDGHPGMCHGGLLSLIFDDAIHELASQELPGESVTVTLNVTFRRPVRTPTVVVCRVWMEKEPARRKAWVQASIEDGLGGVHASAQSFILKMKEKL
ncbi:HotDog domain-containing protein [Pyrenochaeta sp. MPI-SDFR-AT-0127]|nr:HotDog domain-containing protein [Pyrenochaeta sp. MPI-SDFR-AT-0127]